MKPETELLEISGYRIWVEHYANPQSDKTIILVNGALATTASFTQTVRNLRERINIVLFDLPFAGMSRAHNSSAHVLAKDDEVNILLGLIERYRANYLMSASWGGVSSLLSLVKQPPTIEKAIICSFSPVINHAMRDDMNGARRYLAEQNIPGGANLLNSTVGKYLPSLLKQHNYQYLLEMVRGNEEQIMFHIDQIFELDHLQYIEWFSRINVPVLFVNGALDEYTTINDVRMLANHIKRSQFAAIENAGHFIDLENRQAWRALGAVKRAFLFDEETLPHIPCPAPGSLGSAMTA
jgi:rhamnosyltransferase subunit A